MVARFASSIVALVLVTTGCGGTAPAPGDRAPVRPHYDAGEHHDGEGSSDAGLGGDKPRGDADAGAPRDAGRDGLPHDPDAGWPSSDASEPTADAGELAGDVDAGASTEGHAPPTDAALAYFADLDQSLRDQALVAALHDKLSKDHKELTYAALWSAYASVDTDREGCAGIFDFYSSACWSAAQKCGSYEAEGDCFNREHTWPKSWWGGSEALPQHHDLIVVLPTDGYVNFVRGNLPYGDVTDPDYVSSNGSRRGRCAVAGAPVQARCFEPADHLKGDIARIYFYFAVRYEAELGCCNEDAVERSDIKAWQEVMLRTWHVRDPVDLAERTRNERVFALQKTRNPFVDLPHLVDQISDF